MRQKQKYYLFLGDRYVGDYNSPKEVSEAKARVKSRVDIHGNHFWVIKGTKVEKKKRRKR